MGAVRYPWASSVPVPASWVGVFLGSLWGGAAWRARARLPVAALLILATVALLYSPALLFGFVHDDFQLARPLSGRQLLSTLWGTWDPLDHVNRHYRPVVAATFAVDHALWGPEPFGYHLTNLLVLCLCGVAGWDLLSRLTRSRAAALLGTMTWLTHPLTATTASWTSQRTDSIAVVFYLAALSALLSESYPRRRWLPLLLFALALGSKESAVTLPVLAALLVLGLRLGGRQRALGYMALMTGGYLAFWWLRFSDKARDTAATLAVDQWAGWAPRMLCPVFLPVRYAEWHAGRDQDGSAVWIVLAAAGLAALAGGFLWSRGRSRAARVLLVAMVWPVVTLAPLLALKGGMPDVYRNGFLACFGAGLAVAGATLGFARRRRVRLLIAIPLAAFLAPRAVSSSYEWSPRGSRYQQWLRWLDESPTWLETLTPEMRQRFEMQVRRYLAAPADQPDPVAGRRQRP